MTITKNGVAAPSTTGSVQVSGTLPAGTTCTGGSDGASCLVSFTTAGGFGNCVLVSQGGAGGGGATNAAAAGANASGTTRTGNGRTGNGRNRNNNARVAVSVFLCQRTVSFSSIWSLDREPVSLVRSNCASPSEKNSRRSVLGSGLPEDTHQQRMRLSGRLLGLSLCFVFREPCINGVLHFQRRSH